MTKQEIAELLQVSITDIELWVQQWAFSNWLDVCPGQSDKVHDELDIEIFTLINNSNNKNKDVPYSQRIELIKRELNSNPRASGIKEKRIRERYYPENARWEIVADPCLRYDYEWLSPLRSSVDNIISFGCWASSDVRSTCSEPYALLWTLEAEQIVVIDKKSEYIQNAQEWLKTARKQHPYFTDYNLEFVVGDITQKVDTFGENSFDLAYCKNTLYQIKECQVAVNTMARVVKPGGWVIAVESIDLYKEFEKAGLKKEACWDGTPEYTYCYRKPLPRK